MQWPHLISQVKNRFVDFIARKRHLCCKFVQHWVNTCVQNKTIFKCTRKSRKLVQTKLILKIKIVKSSGLAFWPTLYIISVCVSGYLSDVLFTESLNINIKLLTPTLHFHFSHQLTGNQSSHIEMHKHTHAGSTLHNTWPLTFWPQGIVHMYQVWCW